MSYDKINMKVSMSRMSDTLYLLHLDGGSEDERHTFVVDEQVLMDISQFTGYCVERVLDGDMPMNGDVEVFEWDEKR